MLECWNNEHVTAETQGGTAEPKLRNISRKDAQGRPKVGIIGQRIRKNL